MARKPKVRAPYKMVSSTTWELARAAYLGGETAQAVADRFGIGPHNLRQRIYREGWSKRALADARLVAGPGGPDPRPGPSAAPPETSAHLAEAMALVQLRQIWAPLNAEEAQWRDDTRRASGPSVVSEP